MWNPLSLLNAAGDITKAVFGSKQDRDSQLHDETMGVQRSYSAEFNSRNNRTWWDSLIDGINRIPRPLFVGFIVYYFVLCVKDSALFNRINQSLATVPEPMWYILGGVLGFYFGSRHFQKMGEVKAGFKNAVPAVVIPPIKKELPAWYKIAKAEMNSGVAEVKGVANNPRILEYHKATSLRATNDETAWCSAFINWCMMMVGEVRTNKANARSWLDWGIELDAPKEGCVVVFSRGSESWMGHVGLFVGEKGGNILCLGGNQGDKISISSYPNSKVLGYRWPE